jgi:ribose-phosphate pyrophosphokinase
LGDYYKKRALQNLVVVAADINATKRARNMGSRLGAPLAIMEKRRLGNADKTEMLNVIGDVKGKIALIVDDEIDTAGSMTGVVNTLLERGAREVHACCTHGLFSGPAIQRMTKSPVKEIVVTDTYPIPAEKRIDKITILPIAPLLGEAIRRIHTGQSVGAMFE